MIASREQWLLLAAFPDLSNSSRLVQLLKSHCILAKHRANSTRLVNRLVAIVEHPASLVSYGCFTSETQPQCKLDLPGRCGCHCDDAELRCVDKAPRHIEVGMIEGIEELGSEL